MSIDYSHIPKYSQYHRPIALLPQFRLNQKQEGKMSNARNKGKIRLGRHSDDYGGLHSTSFGRLIPKYGQYHRLIACLSGF